MKFFCNFIFLVLCLSKIATAVEIDNCFEPFADRTQKFYLQSELDCNEETSLHQLAILKGGSFQEINDDISYIGPTCFGEDKVIQTYHGKITFDGVEYDRVLHWGDYITPGDSSLFKVAKTCDGEALGVISNKIENLSLQDGTSVSTCFQMKADDAQQSLLGYVRVDEHDTNIFELRDVSDEVIASAKRTFEREGDKCFANWEVENPKEFDPTVLAFAIGWKENQAFSCALATEAPSSSPIVNLPPLTQTSSGLSSGEIAGIVVGSTVGVVAVAGCVFWKFFGKKIRAMDNIQTVEAIDEEYVAVQTPVAIQIDPIKEKDFPILHDVQVTVL